jgi:hypothetical protein
MKYKRYLEQSMQGEQIPGALNARRDASATRDADAEHDIY